MKKLVLTALLAATTVTPALADHNNGGNRGNARAAAPTRAAPAHAAPVNIAPQMRAQNGTQQGNSGRTWTPPAQRTAPAQVTGQNRTWQGNGNNRVANGANWNRGPAQYHGNWNTGWRNDARYNWQGWRNAHRNYYHLSPYYNPFGYGFGYTLFDIGWTIDPAFYAQGYWIDNTDYYRLPPAYGDTRWVRYYNDALLVDINTGYVVDVIHNFFW